MADLIDRQDVIDAFDLPIYNIKGKENAEKVVEYLKEVIQRIKDLPSAQPDRSLWFRIGEICVDESKGFISSGRAVEKIRELLREAERKEEWMI